MERMFWHAREILDAAQHGGDGDCEVAILVSADGAIRMLDASGWALESLLLDSGAAAAYRVDRRGRRVRLEARSVGQHCRLDSHEPPLVRPLAEF